MIVVRNANERGLTQIDWLRSYHTFSFGDYYDENFMGFGSIRVINEDRVQPGKGFGTHAHRDMEIVSYVVSGALEHKDSMGTGSIIRPGEIQRMSAGTGVSHSEYNHSKDEIVHFLQIWILPYKTGLTPSYEQKIIPKIKDQLILIGAQTGQDNTVTIHQKVSLYAAKLSANTVLRHDINNRKGWVQIIKGKLDLNGKSLMSGDGAAFKDEQAIELKSSEDAEILLFDLT